MNSHGRLYGWAGLIVIGAVVAGCGGGGGGSSAVSSGGGKGGLPKLSGLEGDADNHDILYFSGNHEEGGKSYSTLYAVDPNSANSFYPQHLSVQEDNRSPEELARVLYRPLYEAGISDVDGRVSGYRVSDVLFLHNRESGNATSEGFARASTDGPISNQLGARVSSVTYADAPNLDSAGLMLRQNYLDADRAEISWGLPGNRQHIRTTFSDSDDPADTLGSIVHYIVPHSHVANETGVYRYLSLQNDAATQCNGFFITSAFTNTSAVNGAVVSNLLPAGLEAVDAIGLGGPLADEKQYVVINVQDQADCSLEASLWLFDPNAPIADALVPVLNESDEPLVFPLGVAGGPLIPADRHVAQQGNVLYFGATGAAETGPQDLFRVEGASWSFLAEQEENLGYYTGFVIASDGRVAASVGNKVVSWNEDGTDRLELDESDAAWLGIMTEVIGSRNGWIFYNRADITGEDNAVAMKIDGTDSAVIPGAQWFGASITGRGPSVNELDELHAVYFWCDRDIGAVDAGYPAAGVLSLGKLDATPDNVVMYGKAPGPHRLIQVYPNGSDEGRVYYTNTREANSLQAMTVGDPIGHQRPVDGF